MVLIKQMCLYWLGLRSTWVTSYCLLHCSECHLPVKEVWSHDPVIDHTSAVFKPYFSVLTTYRDRSTSCSEERPHAPSSISSLKLSSLNSKTKKSGHFDKENLLYFRKTLSNKIHLSIVYLNGNCNLLSLTSLLANLCFPSSCSAEHM